MPIELIESNTTELTAQDRAAMALNSSKTEADLLAMAAKNAHIVAVIDRNGREQAHGAAMELKRARTTVAKVSKEAREDATAFQKAVIAEEKRLIAIIEPEETRLTELRDKWDDIQLLLKQEAEAKERARITAIHERIAEIRSFSTLAAQCRTAIRIDDLLVKLQAFDMEGFEEFNEEAQAVYASAVSGVTFIRDEKQAEEAERARVKAQQEAEAAALVKAQAEQAAAAAQLAADRAALEKERAELAAVKAAAQQAIEDAKPKAEPVDTQQPTTTPEATQVVTDPTPSADSPVRPTDMAIVEVLASHYQVSESMVLSWLFDMDMDAITDAICGEFV